MADFPPTFSVAELTRSERAAKQGIPNVPTDTHKASLAALAWNVLHPLREWYGKPIKVTSGYRSKALNAATPGSSATSQHSLGEAADIVASDGDNAALFHHIRKHLPFDQVIAEFPDANGNPRWVHVSYRTGKRRGQVLVATKGKNGKTQYANWKP